MRRTFAPPTVPFATRASPSLRHPSKRQASASCSTIHQPTLCRVRAYSSPGLPSPTMTFMGSLSVLLGASGSSPRGDGGALAARRRNRKRNTGRWRRLLGRLLFLGLGLANELGLGCCRRGLAF